jgi:hypothetical protein
MTAVLLKEFHPPPLPDIKVLLGEDILEALVVSEHLIFCPI